jgi:uncharacterized membrane protein
MKRVNCLNAARGPAVWAAALLLAFGLNNATACPKCNQPPKYTVIELKPLPGQASAYLSGLAGSLNQRGQVVGASYADPTVAVGGCVWQKGSVQELPPAPLPWTLPNAVNDSGRIVAASCEPFSINCHAYVLERQHWVQLPDLNAIYCNAAPLGVNNRGTVIGTVWKSLGLYGNEPPLPVVWRHGRIETLPILDLGPDRTPAGDPLAINDRDQVIGRSGDWFYDEQGNKPPPYYMHATLWEKGEIIDLNEDHDYSVATDINNAGCAVGTFINYDPDSPDGVGPLLVQRPCAWTKRTGLVEIGTLPGYPFGFAFALSDGGDIVGQVAPFFTGYCPPTDMRAVLWKHGVIYNLNECVPAGSDWNLYQAFAINARGQIAVLGVNTQTGAGGTFLLNPQWCKLHQPMDD